MSLLTIAEILAGETLVSPGGPVDRLTAAGDHAALWPVGLTDAAELVVAEQAAALV